MGMNSDVECVGWQACTVKWKREDAPALAAWYREGRNGIGLLVYTTPVLPDVAARGVDTCAVLYRYIVAGHVYGYAGSIGQAQCDALACAQVADYRLSTSRHRTRRAWFAAVVKLDDTERDSAAPL